MITKMRAVFRFDMVNLFITTTLTKQQIKDRNKKTKTNQLHKPIIKCEQFIRKAMNFVIIFTQAARSNLNSISTCRHIAVIWKWPFDILILSFPVCSVIHTSIFFYFRCCSKKRNTRRYLTIIIVYLAFVQYDEYNDASHKLMPTNLL